MRKFKRVISGLLAGIMLSAVIAPLIDVMPVRADSNIYRIHFEGASCVYLLDFTGGWYDLAKQAYKPMLGGKDDGPKYLWFKQEEGNRSSDKLSWSRKLNDANDFDGDGFSFVDTTNGESSSCYTEYVRKIRNIKAQSSDSEYAKLTSIGPISLDSFDSTLAGALQLSGNADDVLYQVWEMQQCTQFNNDSECFIWFGCDFDIEHSRFIYYTVEAEREKNYADNFSWSVFYSDKYIAPTDANTGGNKLSNFVEGDKTNKYDAKSASTRANCYVTPEEDIMTNVAIIVEMLAGKGSSSIFTRIFNEETLTDEDVRKIKTIDSLLNYDRSTVSVQGDYGIIACEENTDNELPTYAIVKFNSGYDGKNDARNKQKYVIPTADFEITTDFAVYGDVAKTCTPTGFTPENAVSPLQQMCGEIICGAVNASPTDASGKTQRILDLFTRPENGISENGFTYTLLKTYKDKLDDCITQSYVSQITVDGSNVLVLDDNAKDFDILEAILRYSIQCEVAGEPLASLVEYKGKKYAIVTASDGRFTAKDEDIIDISELYSGLNNYQKAALATSYHKKWDTICKSYTSSRRIDYVYKKYTTDSSIFEYAMHTEVNVSIEDAQKLVESYENSNLVNTGLVTNVARNCNVLAWYTVASNLYMNEYNEGSGNELYGIYNANLEALIKTQWTYKPSNSNNAQQDYFSHLPRHIGIFDGASGNTEYYNIMTSADHVKRDKWERLINLLYNTEYAFSTLAFSELGDNNGYTPEQILGWFETGGGQGAMSWLEASKGLSAYAQAASNESFNFNNDPFSINLLRSIIELHDMCEFLGIGKNDWSESIKMYLDVYDKYEPFFNALRNNPVIYSKIKQEPQSPTEPLAMFFSIQNKSVSDNWAKGFALSSTFVPMETNLYEASSVMFLNDAEWISEFYYKYAFYRKALYINTDNSAIVNNFVSGTTSGTRVATLNDLLNYERDIVLTIDDNFYNANEINSVIDAMDYTSMRNTANAEDTATGFKQVENCISDLMDLSADQILKTGSASYYSENLAKNVRKFGEAYESLDIYTNMVDCYVLSQDDLVGTDNVFESYEYSPKVSYAVVSSIYRSADLYNESLKALASDNAIFKSSKAICTTPGTTSTNWRSIYNYAMLSNLSEQMKNDASSTLDLDAPIFCDLFGNIVTESGLVIIPAAANATLCGKYWTPYAVGFAEYYNNGNKLKVTDFSDAFNTWMIGRTYTTNPEGNAETNTIDTSKKTEKKNAGGFFEVDSNGNLVLKAQSITSGNISAIIQWDILNKNSSIVKQIFFNDAYFNKAANMYSPVVVNLMLETMRGAPIEDIDYTFEGLDGNQNISKYGVYMAYKLEELLDALMPSTNGGMTGGNSLVTMPNLAFMPGVEYIMLYAFKIIFAVLIVALVAQLYLDAVRNHIGFKSVGKFLMTCAMVILAFTVVPTLITWSYYKANKVLLNDETGRIAMLNYVKEFDGSEIGITQVTTPETQTELYLKLDDVSIEWWSIIPDVLFGNTYESVSDLYRKQATDHPYANNTNIITKGSGMYISVQDVFDSTDINYRPTSSMLTNTMYTYAPAGSGVVNSNAPVSYTMPYYVILDQLIANINEYNASRDITAYSWTIGANGHIMTYDVITPYLTSAEFLDDGMDILGMDRILVTGVNRPLYNFAFQGDFTDSGNPSGDLARMSKSLWYPAEKMDMSTRLYKVNELYKAARDYVADNKDVLGKVPDEVFIKVMALQLAIEYNKIFNVAYGNGIEIMNVDTRDLLRFMVADNSNVYKYYSYSFARYTYEQSGGLGVIFSALLLAILWLTGFIKPLFMAIILGLLVINCVFRKLLFKKESRCIEGYLIGCACLVLVNYAYALMLKVSMLINNIGLGSILSLSVGFIVQIVYVALLCLITYIEIKDWKNSGFNEFAVIGSNITSSIMKTQHLIVDKLMSKTSTSYKESAQSRAYSGDKYDSESIERMHQRDAEREDNGTYNPA